MNVTLLNTIFNSACVQRAIFSVLQEAGLNAKWSCKIIKLLHGKHCFAQVQRSVYNILNTIYYTSTDSSIILGSCELTCHNNSCPKQSLDGREVYYIIVCQLNLNLDGFWIIHCLCMQCIISLKSSLSLIVDEMGLCLVTK